MERVRSALVILCVLFFKHQRSFGTEMKIKVKQGDNVTLYCDCVIPVGSMVVWIKNESYGTQSSLFIDFPYLVKDLFNHFGFAQNSTSNSYDLHIKNVSVYDEGIYYCGKTERTFTDVKGELHSKLEYQYGNRRTRLSLLEPVPSDSTLPEVFEFRCNCWMLLLSVCSVCVLISLLLSAACVHCLCRTQTTELSTEILKEDVYKMDPTEKHQCKTCGTGKFCLHSEVTYRLIPSGHHYAKM